MAEASAAAAATVSQHRFFCHSCKGEVSPKLPVSAGGWGRAVCVCVRGGRRLSAPRPPPAPRRGRARPGGEALPPQDLPLGRGSLPGVQPGGAIPPSSLADRGDPPPSPS